jgi:ribosomal protein S18 acetylase RimI-like enzyme
MAPATVRPLRAAERDAAVDALARSFDDDPLFRWLLPSAPSRFAWITWLHGLSVDHSLAHGAVFTPDAGPDHGAITVLPPSAPMPTIASILRGLRSPPRHLPPPRLIHTGLRIEARIDAARPKGATVYVHVLGVHPSHKGRGLGGALLDAALAMAARAEVPLYLETANPVNLGFYGRYGLSVREEMRVGGAPPLWTLQTDGPPALRVRP